jgi:hypothetical protein
MNSAAGRGVERETSFECSAILHDIGGAEGGIVVAATDALDPDEEAALAAIVRDLAVTEYFTAFPKPQVIELI